MSDLNETNMGAFWNEAWAEGYTGWKAFEQSKPFAENLTATGKVVQSFLATHEGRVKLEASTSVGRRVGFVPLCGDTFAVRALLDLGVVDCCLGADLSATAIEAAVQALFVAPAAEAGGRAFDAKVEAHGDYAVHRVYDRATQQLAAGYVVGDLFSTEVQGALRSLAVEGRGAPATDGRLVNFIYDRASMIALPPSLRAPYVSLLVSLLGPNASSTTTSSYGLLDGMVFLELARRPDDEFQLIRGPPFHIPEATVIELYGSNTTGDVPAAEWHLGSATKVAGNAQLSGFEGFALLRVK